MIKKVVIRGPWHGRDRKYIENSDDLEIIPFPHLNSTADFVSFIENCRDADLVIFALFGANLDSYFNISELIPFFNDTNIRKVYWTQDAQHEWGMGLKYQQWFQRYYVNHSESMRKYDRVETYWLPGCFFSIGIDELIDLLSSPKEIERDIIFPCSHYSLDDRNIVAEKIGKKLSKRRLNYYLGKIEFGVPYLRAIQGSRMCLNISTLGSLNIRNFEVLAVNRILLVEKVTDHERIKLDHSHTYFFKRDLSDFDEALEKGLYDTSSDIQTSNNILNHHMLVHRYVEMINNELDTQYTVPNITFDVKKVAESITICNEIRNILHSEKIEEAHDMIEQAVEEYPHSPDPLNLRGELMMRLGKIEEATKIFLDIKERWPYSVDTLNNIAVILSFRQDWEGAKKLLQKALRLSPSHKSVLENLSFVQNEILVSKAKYFIKKGNLLEAMAILKEIITSDVQHLEALNQLAFVYIKTGNFEEAKKTLSLVFQTEPDNKEAKLNLQYLNERKAGFSGKD